MEGVGGKSDIEGGLLLLLLPPPPLSCWPAGVTRFRLSFPKAPRAASDGLRRLCCWSPSVVGILLLLLGPPPPSVSEEGLKWAASSSAARNPFGRFFCCSVAAVADAP